MLKIENYFCTHPNCKDYGIRGKGNLNVHSAYGKHKRHILYCTTCKARFSETKCTAFFGTKYSAKQIGSIIHCAAEGNGVRTTARILKLDKDAVNRVILNAGEHCQKMMDNLLVQLALTEVQMDELWSFIKKNPAAKMKNKAARPGSGQPSTPRRNC